MTKVDETIRCDICGRQADFFLPLSGCADPECDCDSVTVVRCNPCSDAELYGDHTAN